MNLISGYKYFVWHQQLVHGALGSTMGGHYVTFCGAHLSNSHKRAEKEVITCLDCLSHQPR